MALNIIIDPVTKGSSFNTKTAITGDFPQQTVLLHAIFLYFNLIYLE